ncbi:Maf family protein [Aquibacillus salsiterrae]|uniref:dTTP/UTP pyrophosphatase n=1 Tax=Aquibacillus salsiterrae TaxID=2950439 RepID=A0A9X4ADT9_9BACI|nr:Maf family protein [Aquibacillus salsiterrae]MDC3415674.1 Maf family protein [Aquibacillus salsiterrae]
MKLILASGSPRRKELLEQVSFRFEVLTTDVDESTVIESDPETLVKKLAYRKGEAVTIQDDQVVLTADTVVSFDGQILTKPATVDEAVSMLTKLNGKQHDVWTAVRIKSVKKDVLITQSTSVEFWNVPQKVIDAYVGTGDPFDKAGGYGIQTAGALFVKQIEGDYYNVVGLPLSKVVQCLRDFDVHPSFVIA